MDSIYNVIHTYKCTCNKEKVCKFKENGEGYMREFRRGKERQNGIIKIKFP